MLDQEEVKTKNIEDIEGDKEQSMASSTTTQNTLWWWYFYNYDYFVDTAVISLWHQSHMTCIGISIQGKNPNSTYLPYVRIRMILANPSHLFGIFWRHSVVLPSAYSLC